MTAMLATETITDTNLVKEKLSLEEFDGNMGDKMIVKMDVVEDIKLTRPASEYLSAN